MTELELRDIEPADLDRLTRIRSRSFGMMTGDQSQWRRQATEAAAEGRYLGVLVGDRLVGAARIWDFHQWWLGRRVRMGGVASVVVTPEFRGRGAATAVMRGVLARTRELGMPLSALYPATLPVYRGLGYEFGGGRHRFEFLATALRALGQPAPGTIREGGPEDAPRLLELVAAVRTAGRESGMLGWDEQSVREWLTEESAFCYLAEDGFVVYGWDKGNLRVDELVAGSEATARGLWATVGSGASIARTVTAYVSPDDPIHLLAGDEASHENHVERWMLRLVDAPTAIGARGWTAGVSVDVVLRVDDAELPANSGTWRLRVAGGAGWLDRVEDAPGVLRVGARGLAALYSGTSVASLRVSGLATGGAPPDDGLLDAVFTGPTAYMLDYF